MSGKWWTIVSIAVAAKLYLLGSWLWTSPDDAHAETPQAKTTSLGASGSTGDATGAKPAPREAPAEAPAEASARNKKAASAASDLDDAAESAREGEASGAAAAKKEKPLHEAPRADGADAPSLVTSAADVIAATPRACLAALRSIGDERAQHDLRKASLLVRERAVQLREDGAKTLLREALALSKSAEASLKRAIAERKQGRTERTLRLAKLLGVMKPLEAAAVLARLSTPHAVAALAEMEEGRAGKILGALPPEIAASISEALLSQAKSGEVVKAAAPAKPEPVASPAVGAAAAK